MLGACDGQIGVRGVWWTDWCQGSVVDWGACGEQTGVRGVWWIAV